MEFVVTSPVFDTEIYYEWKGAENKERMGIVKELRAVSDSYLTDPAVEIRTKHLRINSDSIEEALIKHFVQSSGLNKKGIQSVLTAKLVSGNSKVHSELCVPKRFLINDKNVSDEHEEALEDIEKKLKGLMSQADIPMAFARAAESIDTLTGSFRRIARELAVSLLFSDKKFAKKN